MKLIEKKWKSIILIVLTALILLSMYTLISGSKDFTILDIDKINSINDPALKIAVGATEECNKIEIKDKNHCYAMVAWELGYYYETLVCENLNKKFKHPCYQGYGKKISQRYSPDIIAIQDECSKIAFYKDCLLGAALAIGKESAGHIETEQCKKFEQENVKQACDEGIGRELADSNRELILCEKVKNKERCLIGFAFITDERNRKEALQICDRLSEKYATRCYSFIGRNNPIVYKKNVKESFEDCKQYTYAENCKQGATEGMIKKFFENEASST